MTVGELREYLEAFGDHAPVLVQNNQGDRIELVAGYPFDDDDYACAFLQALIPPDTDSVVLIVTPWIPI